MSDETKQPTDTPLKDLPSVDGQNVMGGDKAQSDVSSKHANKNNAIISNLRG